MIDGSVNNNSIDITTQARVWKETYVEVRNVDERRELFFGIGLFFFEDAVHRFLGIQTTTFQKPVQF